MTPLDRYLPDRESGERLKQELARKLPHPARAYLESGLSGDADAGLRLIISAPDNLRGLVGRAAWNLQLPRPALRSIVGNLWRHSYVQLIADVGGDLEAVRALLASCGSPVPETIPETVNVYRGTPHASFEEARQGLSWSLSRDVACWFASRSSPSGPLVLKAKVPKTDIIFFDDNLREDEVVLRCAVPAVVDGTIEEWFRIGKQREDENDLRRKLFFANLARMQAAGVSA